MYKVGEVHSEIHEELPSRHNNAAATLPGKLKSVARALICRVHIETDQAGGGMTRAEAQKIMKPIVVAYENVLKDNDDYEQVESIGSSRTSYPCPCRVLA
jgi:hypothetical protein